MVRSIAVVLLAFLGLAAARAEASQPSDIDFRVFRDGEEIGHHRVTFSREGDDLIAETSIELAVTFASIRVFYYNHSSREVWRDGALQALTSTTYDDGDDHTLSLQRQGDGFVVQGTRFSGPVSADAVPTSYWFPQMVSAARFIDTQNGRVFDGRIERVGAETIEVGGVQVPATRYTLTEALEMNLWYDAAGRWVRTSFEARGSQIEYVLAAPLPPVTASN